MSSFVLQITLHVYLESYNIFDDSMFDLSTSPANISLNQTLFWSFQIRVPKVETINVQVKRFFLKKWHVLWWYLKWN